MLSLGKIKVGKHIFEEAGDGVGVLVFFGLDDTGELLDVVSRANVGGFGSSAGDDGGGNKVSEEVGARGLDGVKIGRGKEHVEQTLAALVFSEIEKHKQRPVKQPCSGLKLSERLGKRGTVRVVDGFAEVSNLHQSSVPFTVEDVGGEFTPLGREVELVRGRENEEVVEEVPGRAIVTEGVLVLTKVVKGIDLVNVNLQDISFAAFWMNSVCATHLIL